jgi:hypothetical protein
MPQTWRQIRRHRRRHAYAKARAETYLDSTHLTFAFDFLSLGAFLVFYFRRVWSTLEKPLSYRAVSLDLCTLAKGHTPSQELQRRTKTSAGNSLAASTFVPISGCQHVTMAEAVDLELG